MPEGTVTLDTILAEIRELRNSLPCGKHGEDIATLKEQAKQQEQKLPRKQYRFAIIGVIIAMALGMFNVVVKAVTFLKGLGNH